MRLGICVCECVHVMLYICVRTHACLCPHGRACVCARVCTGMCRCAYVYVCTCVFAAVCVGYRTHLSQTRFYLLPSENSGEELPRSLELTCLRV